MGNLRTFSNGTKYTLHWDGADLVLVTTGSSVEQMNVEKLAEATSSSSGLGPLVVYDRDFSGSVVEEHTYQNDSGVDVAPDHFGLNKLGLSGIPNITGTWPSSGSSPVAPPLIDMQRTDGYQVGDLTVQGVRAYDANAQQRTTPDDYKGDVENPMTQRPYQWNGGNPIAMADASGYSTNNPQSCADGSSPALQGGSSGSSDSLSSWGFSEFSDVIPGAMDVAVVFHHCNRGGCVSATPKKEDDQKCSDDLKSLGVYGLTMEDVINQLMGQSPMGPNREPDAPEENQYTNPQASSPQAQRDAERAQGFGSAPGLLGYFGDMFNLNNRTQNAPEAINNVERDCVVSVPD